MEWYSSYLQWKNFEGLDNKLSDELNNLRYNKTNLKDSFIKNIEFGTAGIRGIMGPGINRINIYTIRHITEGLAQYIIDKGTNARKRGVVISYDSRKNSYKFAIEASKVLASHCIKTYMFEDVRPTPELSFSVRKLNCISGIMITASHNPSEYNGFKLFGEDGGQVDREIVTKIRNKTDNIKNIFDINTITKSELLESKYYNILNQDIDNHYLQSVKSVVTDTSLFGKNKNNIQVVYTPLHGCGGNTIKQLAKDLGLNNLKIVPEQELPESSFNTVISPNPEDPKSFDMAINLGKKINADLLVATDPDADRLGVAVLTKNEGYKILSGNQLASIMIYFLLESLSKSENLPTNSYIAKSIVSTDLAADIASSFGISTYEVPIGFKYIAKIIYDNPQKNFIFGFEESYGYLVKPFVRDKDAIQAFLLSLEMCSFYKSKGLSLDEVLEKIYQKYGYYQQITKSIPLESPNGDEIDVLTKLRLNDYEPYKTIFNPIIDDYSLQQRIFPNGDKEILDIDPNETLKFHLNNNDWFAIRQSGTEPILKIYVGSQSESLERAEEQIQKIFAVINKTIN